MKMFVSTESWETQNGTVAKAVIRDEKGRFIGATNSTKVIPAKKVTRPRVTLIGR